MARSDVIMNDALLPIEEMIPEAWDGVPVTWGHPNDGTEFVSANTPATLSKWSIGRMFNVKVEGTSLKGEAWIEVDRAAEVAGPDFIKSILSAKKELPIDVSTGYFSRDDAQSGELNGRSYSMVNRAVMPNHLAILVGEEGACSWADGCGVRSNSRRKTMKGVKLNKKQTDAFEVLRAAVKGGAVDKNSLMVTLFANERGQDDDRRQIIADLISSDDSPYTPDDEQSLMMMSDATVRRMREDYLSGNVLPVVEDPDKDKEAEEKPAANADADEKENKDMAGNALPKTQAELDEAINKVVTAALKKNQPKAIDAKALAAELGPLLITADMRSALALATNQVAAKRSEMIAKIVANTSITEEAAKAFDDKTLELVSNGIFPTPNYTGRVITRGEEEVEDAEVAAMTAHLNIRDELADRRKKKSA